jgi:hypothetical protein
VLWESPAGVGSYWSRTRVTARKVRMGHCFGGSRRKDDRRPPQTASGRASEFVISAASVFSPTHRTFPNQRLRFALRKNVLPVPERSIARKAGRGQHHCCFRVKAEARSSLGYVAEVTNPDSGPSPGSRRCPASTSSDRYRSAVRRGGTPEADAAQTEARLLTPPAGSGCAWRAESGAPRPARTQKTRLRRTAARRTRTGRGPRRA